MNVAQDVAADAQDHRPVAFDERREGRGGVGVTAAAEESLQEQPSVGFRARLRSRPFAVASAR